MGASPVPPSVAGVATGPAPGPTALDALSFTPLTVGAGAEVDFGVDAGFVDLERLSDQQFQVL